MIGLVVACKASCKCITQCVWVRACARLPAYARVRDGAHLWCVLDILRRRGACNPSSLIPGDITLIAGVGFGSPDTGARVYP